MYNGNKMQDIKTDKSYIVSGALSFSLIDQNDNPVGGYEYIGTMSEVSMSATSDKISKDETVSGKNLKVFDMTIKTDVELSMSITDFSSENISRFVFGKRETIASAVAVETELKVNLGRIVPVGFIVDTSTNPFVLKDKATGLITYVNGVNYELQDSDFYVYTTEEQNKNGAANLITEDQLLTLTCDKLQQYKISGFSENSLIVAARFTGVNIAQNNQPIIMEFPKISIEPAEWNILSAKDVNEATFNASLIKAKGKDLLTISMI